MNVNQTSKMFVILLAVLATNTNVAVGEEGQGAQVIESRAQAWFWVPPEDQQRFIDGVRRYAKLKSLTLNVTEFPAPPWKSVDMILVTPNENEIKIIGVSASGKFSASVTVLHENEDWKSYWKEFRAYIRSRYKWEDVP